MLRNNAIRPCQSPWASSIALVKKSDGINSSDSQQGAKKFSALNLKSGYWQVEVAEKDREKTAFVVPTGLLGFAT
ncbi:unnamed protein product [Hydatigera taeniaeformis]|uniref:Transposon Ty3-I Gag-Pol polyprotein n=1 Tax=Hydatigena taeniaeformis TaxID=6205 RepID=A0A0R3X8E8_HYDTA|nr:unnamed protein product [Hydatigera taeniaeformis]